MKVGEIYSEMFLWIWRDRGEAGKEFTSGHSNKAGNAGKETKVLLCNYKGAI